MARVVSVKSAPAWSSAVPSANAPIRTLGPVRSCRIATGTCRASARRRSRRIVSRCSSRVPWEKLSRATSIPASRSALQGLLGRAGGADRGDDLRPPVSALRETLGHDRCALGAARPPSCAATRRGAATVLMVIVSAPVTVDARRSASPPSNSQPWEREQSQCFRVRSHGVAGCAPQRRQSFDPSRERHGRSPSTAWAVRSSPSRR